jgi:hypothetical protein
MSTARRIEANRANARGSTGPRTAAGKTRSSRNARRHGLSVPVDRDPALMTEVEEFARRLFGEVEDAESAALARAFAEAEVDLARVKRARLELMRRVLALPSSDESAEDDAIGDAAVDEAPSEWASSAVSEAAVSDAIRQLATLNRYERRARARRRRAVRAFTDRFIDAIQRKGLSALDTATE